MPDPVKAADLPWPRYRPCRCCNAQCAWLSPSCPYVRKA